MANENRYVCLVETRKLLSLMGVIFGFLLFVQYIELPYGNIFSSLFGTGKSRVSPIDSFPSIDSYSNSSSSMNSTNFSGLNPISPLGNISSDRYSNSSFSMRNDTERVGEVNGNPAITPLPAVLPISKMNDELLKSYESPQGVRPRWSSTVDLELLNVKAQIRSAPIIGKDPHFDVNLYRNFSAFKRSYKLMEQTLKVYIYAEGDGPIFHEAPLQGIYASEGWFMNQLQANQKFVTKNPNEAHLFYLPFSSVVLKMTLYKRHSHGREKLIEFLSNYLQTIAKKYSFWNRTDGADHFLAACHDWAPAETRDIMANCIRALCNTNINSGFKFGKDASLPVTYVHSPENPLNKLGGNPSSQRQILAFFAGNMHGFVRPVLLNYWADKDPDMKIFGHLQEVKGETTYSQYMKSSKYCICAKGHDVHTPRVVEAIFYECVPVIISDNYVPPFFETLNWESFAVFVLEKDIPNLKNILLSISQERYVQMQRRVKLVQQHFLWHRTPVKYDIFHMILHSVWHNRVLRAT